MTARGGGQLENKKKKAVRITSAPITVPLLAAAVIVMLGVSRFVLERQAGNENNIFLVITVLQLIIFALPCMLYYFLKGRKLASPMYIAPVRPGHLIFIASALATLVTGNLLIKFFYYLFTGEAGTNGTYFAAVVDSAGTDTSTAMVLTALVFIPAVCEEFFFRGVVLAEYRQFGAVNAVVFSSLCFAMLHFSIENFPIYLFSGLMLGMVCAVCRSIFASIVLADEINRASPKTQSALLEVMEEQKVTVDGVTHDVPQPFIVIATQNPIEQLGTYKLPEAQMDRFLIKTSIGYPGHDVSVDILKQVDITDRAQTISPVLSGDDVMRLRQVATEIYVDDAIREYIVRLVEATRHNEKITVGSSMRGALALTRCARIWAAADGRAYVVPDDVKDLAVAVLAHRITLTPEATFDGATPESLIAQVLEDVPSPTIGS